MALYVAQREAGWLPPEIMAEVAELFSLEPSDVGEFASFYEMLHDDHEPGQYHIQVCTNVPCMLRGAGEPTRPSNASGLPPPRPRVRWWSCNF